MKAKPFDKKPSSRTFMLRTRAMLVDLYAASPPVGVAPLPILEAIDPNLTTCHPLGLLTGSPNISRKIDRVRLPSNLRVRLRFCRSASALSKIAAIRRCSLSGGSGTCSDLRFSIGKLSAVVARSHLKTIGSAAFTMRAIYSGWARGPQTRAFRSWLIATGRRVIPTGKVCFRIP